MKIEEMQDYIGEKALVWDAGDDEVYWVEIDHIAVFADAVLFIDDDGSSWDHCAVPQVSADNELIMVQLG